MLPRSRNLRPYELSVHDHSRSIHPRCRMRGHERAGHRILGDPPLVHSAVDFRDPFPQPSRLAEFGPDKIQKIQKYKIYL
jgi:hypothetical protein